MSDKIAPIGVKTKLYITGPTEHVTFEEYRNSKAKEHKLETTDITKVAMATKAGVDYDTSDIEDLKKRKRIEKFMVECEADFSAHAKNKAIVEKNEAEAIQKRKDEKEAAEKAKEADQKESLDLMTTAEGSKKLVTMQSQLTAGADKGISEVLGKAFKFGADGLLEVVGTPQKKDFASAFSGINGLQKTSDVIKDRSAKTEAQVAFVAKETLGESWTNLFSHVPKDLSRVKNGLKIFSTCQRTKSGKFCFAALPISTTKALTEMKVTSAEEEGSIEKANEKNMEAKLAVLKKAALVLKERMEAGGTLTQTEAKNIVTEYKNEQGVEGKIRFKFGYGHVVDGKMEISGSKELDHALLGTAAWCVDYNMNQFIYKDGEAAKQPVSGPSKAVAKLAADFQEDLDAAAAKAEEEKAKKGKKNKKSSAPAPSKDELDEEDEDEENEPKPTKAKVKIDLDEDEDPDGDDDAQVKGSESDEDEDEDEEDTKATLKSNKAPALDLDDEDEDEEPVKPAKKKAVAIDLDDD